MGSCNICVRLCVEPHENPECPKCPGESCENNSTPCSCNCHLSKAEIDSIEGDRLFSEWKEMQDRGQG